jgi:hypothetical protein
MPAALPHPESLAKPFVHPCPRTPKTRLPVARHISHPLSANSWVVFGLFGLIVRQILGAILVEIFIGSEGAPVMSEHTIKRDQLPRLRRVLEDIPFKGHHHPDDNEWVIVEVEPEFDHLVTKGIPSSI